MSGVAADQEGARLEPPKTYYDATMELPGYSQPPDRCRSMTPVGFCEHGHTVLGRSSCGTRYCPDHWRDWCEDATIAIVARLAAYREAADGAEKRLSHIAVSPPQDRRYSADRMWATRSDAYDALEAAGVRGGATVTHPYRLNDRGETLYQAAKEQGDLSEGTGKWRFLRDATEDMDDMRRYVEGAPHYHALGAAEDVRGEDAPEGWVVERIRTFQPFHLRDSEAYEDMARSVYYVLTHAAAQQGRQATTYFGDVHPASFDPEEALTAAAWGRIKIEAEQAVKGFRTPEDGEEGQGPEECPRDDCEAVVRELRLLGEYLDDDDWVSDLLHRSRGRERYQQLRGAWLWKRGMTDRPPPSVLTGEERLLNWLQVQGETGVPEPQQVGLGTAIEA